MAIRKGKTGVIIGVTNSSIAVDPLYLRGLKRYGLSEPDNSYLYDRLGKVAEESRLSHERQGHRVRKRKDGWDCLTCKGG